jgi:hypothetical protein
MRDMILGIAPEDVVTVYTERKIKRKTRKCDGTGLLGTDSVAVVSKPESKVYQVSFFKRKRIDNLTSVPFGYKC